MVDILERNPYLALLWSFGLFLFIRLSQYIGVLLAYVIIGVLFVVF